MKTLFILHGWQSSKERWEKVRELVSKEGIEVIVPDLPGFKTETALKEPWNMDNYVNWFKNLSSDKEEFFLLGHSFGGRMSIKFAEQNPEKVSGLILVSAAGIKNEKTLRQKIIYFIAKIGSVFSFVPGFKLFQKTFYKFVVKKSDYLGTTGTIRETFKMVIEEDLTSYLPKIKSPTLIIWGEEDSITPISDAYLMEKEIIGSKLEILPGVGHMINIEAPKELAARIISFLNF